MAGNAFSLGLVAQRGDAFQFFWRMNPAWRKGQPITIAATLAWWRIHRVIYRNSMETIEAAVFEYIARMLQDMPENTVRENDGNDRRSRDYITWIAAEADFYMRTFGMTFEVYRATPYLVLQQLYRAFRDSTEEDVEFINGSDRILSRWVRLHVAKPDGRD